MLSRTSRLTRGDDYRRVVRWGERCRGAVTVTSVVAGGDNVPARFGFIVSKQVGGAVVRNTVRRRLKAACARWVPLMPYGTDVVIRALPSSGTATWSELVVDIDRCVQGFIRR